MRIRSRLRSALLACLALGAAGRGGAEAAQREIRLKDTLGDPAWPDDFWKTSTPEAEGMDPAKIEAAVRAAKERDLEIHSLLVVRHGKLVVERYGTDGGRQLGPGDLHEVFSITKTFNAALLAIAVAEGKVSSISAPVLPYFEGDGLENRTPAKERITIEDLLTMRSGLDYTMDRNDGLMLSDPRGAATAHLSLAMAAAPGERWNYSSGDSQVIAEIVRRATGETPRAYAEKRLFGPLGIRELRWLRDRRGTEVGGFGLELRPRDLARFGLLYLSKGRWKGEQVVPEEWVTTSTRGRVPTPWAAGTYAYQCWAPKIGGFAARGYMGQEVYVFPDRDLVVVFTARLPSDTADAKLDEIVSQFILPAVKG